MTNLTNLSKCLFELRMPENKKKSRDRDFPSSD